MPHRDTRVLRQKLPARRFENTVVIGETNSAVSRMLVGPSAVTRSMLG
jgi:hypothetical protein